ncbi:glycosyltransferase family 4 protein [bacterium]|nr:glycosyltransferase family 4 protein [candidate division CSSED10-310 bacterium]
MPVESSSIDRAIDRVIGIDIRKIHDFGIGTYIRNLLTGLASTSRPEHTVFRLYTEDCYAADPRRLPPSRFPMVMMHANRRSPLQGALPGLSDLQLYHAPHYLTPDPGKTPFILTVHDCIHLAPPPFPKAFNRLGNPSDQVFDAAKRFYHRSQGVIRFRRYVQRADAIITVSDATSRDLIALTGIDDRKITRVHNCIDRAFFTAGSLEDTGEFCRKFGLPEKDYVLYCGNDLYHKNLAGLLTAWKNLSMRMQTPALVLAGPPRQFMIREYADYLGISDSIILLDRIPSGKMPDLYHGALALVMPSLAEGFGLPVAEAMAMGLPVVCSDIPVFHEITGDHALFCDPYNPHSIEEAVRAAIRDRPSENDRVAAARHQAEAFTMDRFLSGHVSVYLTELEAHR